MAILDVRHLRKSFGTLVAVDDVSFGVESGRLVGLLGPNGAGKTTTVAMLAGLLTPDQGEVLVGGRPLAGDTDPAKRRIGLVPQDLALYDELSARDNLRFFGALFGLSGAALESAMAAALQLVGLAERARDRVKTFSGGMKRRLNLAAGLLHDPEILLLDEPTVGVDPQSRNAIFDNLELLKRRGKTLLYTTHYMEEAERLCDRVTIIDHGKVIADDTLSGLYRQVPAANMLRIELDEARNGLHLEDLRALAGVDSAEKDGEVLKVGVRDLTAATPRVLQWLAEQGHSWQHMTNERASLESVFLTLTGRRLRD